MVEAKEYAYFKRGEYVKKGTRKELAEELGVSENTIGRYARDTEMRGSVDDMQFFLLYRETPVVKAKVNVIKNLIKDEKITQQMVAEWLYMKSKTFSNKLNNYNSFTKDEIERIEDIFRLERGSLLK